MLNRLPEGEDDLLSDMKAWPDNQPGKWYYIAVQEATNSHNFSHKGEVYEHWTELTADPDWTRYEAVSYTHLADAFTRGSKRR